VGAGVAKTNAESQTYFWKEQGTGVD